jgi:hypothetical protein
LPHGNQTAGRQCAQEEGLHHKKDLSVAANFVATEAVGNNAAKRTKNNSRNLSSERNESEHERRMGQTVHKPRLRHALHPIASARDELPGKEQTKIAMV